MSYVRIVTQFDNLRCKVGLHGHMKVPKPNPKRHANYAPAKQCLPNKSKDIQHPSPNGVTAPRNGICLALTFSSSTFHTPFVLSSPSFIPVPSASS